VKFKLKNHTEGIYADEDRWESEISTDLRDIFLNIFRKLPKYWYAKFCSKFSIKTLPKFPDSLDIPNSKTIFSWIKSLCATPHRRPGTPEGHKAEDWVSQKLIELGLKEVRKDPIPIKVWECTNWALKVQNDIMPSFFVVNTGFTSPQGVKAPLVYVGRGTPKDFAKKDVSGKIVVAEVPFPYIPIGLLFRVLKFLNGVYYISDPDYSLSVLKAQYLNFVRRNFIGGSTLKNAPLNDVYWNAFKRGAKGIILILKNQPANSNTHYGPYDGIMKPMPGLWVGKYDGVELKKLAKEKTEATMILNGSIKKGVMHNVWGVLPGCSKEIVMITSHHDSPFQGAVEDGAGVAQVLAQVNIWAKVPKEKRKRTLVFVISAGHFYGSQGGHQFARTHPELMKKVKLLITLEHLGAKEVVERDKKYAFTNQLAFTVIFTSSEPLTIATVVNALQQKPAKSTISIPMDLIADAPTSDAAGFVLESKVPTISWIGCPYYLLDKHDTLDKIAVSELQPICETITELIKPFMY